MILLGQLVELALFLCGLLGLGVIAFFAMVFVIAAWKVILVGIVLIALIIMILKPEM